MLSSVRLPWALAGLWVIAPVLWVELDEGGIPSKPNARTVPAGVDVIREDTEVRIRRLLAGVDAELAGALPRRPVGHVRARGVDLAYEMCRPVSWLDGRVVCLGEIPDRPATRTDETLIYVQWQRPLGLSAFAARRA